MACIEPTEVNFSELFNMARTGLVVYTFCISIAHVSAFAYHPGDPVCLDEDDGKLKFLNEPCKANSDCYDFGKSSTVCKNGLCVCDKGYQEDIKKTTLGERRLCVSAPSTNGDACTDQCQEPYTCAKAQPQSTTAAPEGSTTAAPTGKTCQCLPPYIFNDTVCFLKCKQGEFYGNGRCVKRCSANEYASGNECRKMSKIGGPCQGQADCSVPYSECQGGKCACVPGFSPNKKNDVCDAVVRTCPIGDPVQSKGVVVECKVVSKPLGSTTRKPGEPRIYSMIDIRDSGFEPLRGGGYGFLGSKNDIADTCADDQFCMVTGTNGYAPGAIGHCCRKPKPACPIGRPHPNATCVPHSGAVRSALIDYEPAVAYLIPLSHSDPTVPCPRETHTCLSYAYGGGFEIDLCCPLACSKQRAFINGHCYPKREIDDQCDYDEQCTYTGGACKNGTCACGKNSTLKSNTVSKFCDVSCREGLKLDSEGYCVPFLKLGDPCDNVVDLCGLGAKCSPKTKTCICNCGQSKLDSSNCGPPPNCAPLSNNVTDPIRDLDKIEFCVIPHKSPLLSRALLNPCHKGQYCAKYMETFGVCCELPHKPFCYDGSTPEKSCDPKQPDCTGGRHCVNYLNEAGTEDPNNYYCCPVLPLINED